MPNKLPRKAQSISVTVFNQLSQMIDEDPLSRVPSSMVASLDPTINTGQNNLFFDVHAHSFTTKHVPADFDKSLKFFSVAIQEKILKIFKSGLGNVISLPDQKSVIKSLLKLYAELFSNKKILLCILSMDMERGITGGTQNDFLDQIEELAKIRKEVLTLSNGKQIKLDECLLPFLALDPHNPELFNQFISCFVESENHSGRSVFDDNMPFVGVKIYPCLGYLPNDPTLMDIYSVCEEKNIPITTHVGGTRTSVIYDKVELAERKYKPDGSFQPASNWVDFDNNKDKIKQTLISPRHWDRVLNIFPKLKLNLAHFGDNKEWTKYHDSNDLHTHVHQNLELARKYDHVYLDMSYAMTRKRNIKKIKGFMRDKKYREKIMFGTDYFLTEVEKRKSKESIKDVKKEFENSMELWDLLTNKNPRRFLFGKV